MNKGISAEKLLGNVRRMLDVPCPDGTRRNALYFTVSTGTGTKVNGLVSRSVGTLVAMPEPKG